MILSVLCLFTSAAPVQDGKSAKKTIVAIGDSIASGYMLPDYNPEIARPRTKTGYPVLLANEIGYELVDMSKEGTTTKSVLQNQFSEQYEEYVISPETMWFVEDENGERLSYTFDNRQNLEKLSKADIVTVSVGNYDLVSFFSMKNDILGKLESGEIQDADDLTAFVDEIWTEIDTKTTESAENLRGVFQKIRSFNPTALIAFQNLYNTYEQVDVPPVREFVRIITLVLNNKTEEVCKDMDVMYVDVYSKFYRHQDEDLINMDCPSITDYINGNYQNDSHPTTLGHRYIMETYLEAFEEANILPKYKSHNLEKSYSFTRNEAANGVDKLLPEKVVIKSTDGDYSVGVKQWQLSDEIDLESSKNQTVTATAVLDEATVPAFIRDIGKISTKVTFTGTYDAPAVTTPEQTDAPDDESEPAQTDPSKPEPDEDTKKPGEDTKKPDEDTKSPAEDTGNKAPETDGSNSNGAVDSENNGADTVYIPGDVTVPTATNGDGNDTPKEDTGAATNGDSDTDDDRSEYDADNGQRKMVAFAAIGAVALIAITAGVIYIKKTSY